MGCAAYAGNSHKKDFDEGLIKHIESFRPKQSSDDSVSVIEYGQALEKTQLDCFIENALKEQAAHDRFLNESTEMISPDKGSVIIDKNFGLDTAGFAPSPAINEVLETSKVHFESHPPQFDFSFLDERELTEHEEITDIVLKEFKNL